METIRFLYPDWFVIGVFAFLVLFTIITCCFIFVGVKIIQYISVALEPSAPSILYIKDFNGDNIINIEEIEQITQGYNPKEEQFEIIYYLKSGHELKEIFDDNRVFCNSRFEDVYKILNDINC